jgi:6,7-dimethyl-8-ribityllumazine synthase
MTLKPIAYIQASWHAEITDHCKQAFLAEVATHGYEADSIEFFSAPGSLEIPSWPRSWRRAVAMRRSVPAAS